MSTHLHTISSYSLLKSTIRITDLVRYAKSLGYEHITLTDHNVMYGAASFIDACKKEGIHGIIGMEVDCMYHDSVVPFLLLSKDNQGYIDLMKLSSSINEGENICSLEQLIETSHHCHVIVYGHGGWFHSEMNNNDADGIRSKLEILKNDLKEFDIGLSYNESAFWIEKNTVLKRIAQTMHIPTVALNKIYYLKKEDSSIHQILQGMAENKTIDDHSLIEQTGRYFLTKEEMAKIYQEDDLKRSDEIALMCRGNYDLPKTSLPTYEVKDHVEPKIYLTQLCKAGLNKRLHGQENKQYTDRLMYELSIIIDMHFENYFLIVYDFICWARKNGIYIGPGRGSAASSLVAYCLGITMIDPIQYGLLFERFLNPERISMPDIDVDIPDSDRNKVIEYVYHKYGEDHVCNIVTFGTLGPRMVIREVGKVLNIYTSDIDRITKLIPTTSKMTLDKAYQTVPRFKQMIDSDDKFIKLFSISKRLEGLPHHTSVHASGILMSKESLNHIIPTLKTSEMRTSQYAVEYLQERGLIKMDFLGLRNLSVIDEIVQKIKEREPRFSILNIPLNDPKTYQVFSYANTLGVFQFESEGMKNLLRRMRPTNIQEIADAMALFRPGPMDHIKTYLENRKDPSSVKYDSKGIQSVLQETHGIMIYQEQIMMIARNVAGFSLGKADILRKAITKKNEQEILNLKQDFVSGALKNGYSNDVIERLFENIKEFAGYGFNKAHAIAYTYIAYQLAYLKANYPYDFYIALLNSVISDSNKTSQYIDECKRRKINILYPSINESGSYYQIEKNALRVPLSLINGIGGRISDKIVLERNKNGKYEDIFDLVARSNLYGIGIDKIETLIDAGSCDCFNETRLTLKSTLQNAENYAKLVRVGDKIDESLVSKQGYSRLAENEAVREENERRALGFTLGTSYIQKVREKNNINTPSLASISMMKGKVVGFAQIKEARSHRTKKGTMMSFLKLSDETAEVSMMVMPREYEQYSSSLVKGVFILFHARIQEDGSMFCDSIQFYKK